jgi:hypothetical protein
MTGPFELNRESCPTRKKLHERGDFPNGL